MRKFIIIACLSFLLVSASQVAAATPKSIYFFYGDGCPHCANEEIFFDALSKQNPEINIKRFEVWHDQNNLKLLEQVGKTFKIQAGGVPVTIINNQAVIGFDSAETTGQQIADLLKANLAEPDLMLALLAGQQPQFATTTAASPAKEFISSFFGRLNFAKTSLPLLTMAFGLLDSLNPCAMWSLLFLIGILLSMDNRPKMWLLGWTFIGASALAYFAFLAAWLNIYQLIKYLPWVDLAIALLAITVAIFNFWDFWDSRAGGCDIAANPTRRRIIISKIKNFALNKNFFVALVGLAMIGAAINIVGLICSAGLPAVYIPILTAQAATQLSYYLYLGLYTFCYIIPQLLVFLIAMFSMRQVAVSSRVTRWIGLISGLLMLAIGLYLFNKIDLLTLF